MSRTRLQAIYSGNVQGVGFRYTVKTLVTGYEVTGVIRNMADGRVELTAEGERPELEAFQQAILESGLGHLVRHTEVNWSEPSGEFKGFAIVG